MQGKAVLEVSIGILALVPAQALAAGDGAPSTPGLGELGLRAGLALGAVLGLIALLAVLVRRFRLAPGLSGGGGRLSSIARLDLGARREVRLVSVDRRLLVLGVTSERVELLAQIPADSASSIDDDSADSPGSGAIPFLRQLANSS